MHLLHIFTTVDIDHDRLDCQDRSRGQDARSPHPGDHVEKAPDALQDEFHGVFSRETIARYLAESVDLLGESKPNVFVPVLAHRFARERLKALARAEGSS
jgi:hypothetical protein